MSLFTYIFTYFIPWCTFHYSSDFPILPIYLPLWPLFRYFTFYKRQPLRGRAVRSLFDRLDCGLQIGLYPVLWLQGPFFFTYQSTKYTTQSVNLFDFLSDLLFFTPNFSLLYSKLKTLFYFFVLCYFSNYLWHLSLFPIHHCFRE